MYLQIVYKNISTYSFYRVVCIFFIAFFMLFLMVFFIEFIMTLMIFKKVFRLIQFYKKILDVI